MMPPDIMFYVLQQRRLEMLREAEQARLLRSVRRKPDSGEHAFQQLIWWIGSAAVLGMCPPFPTLSTSFQ